MRPRDKTAAEIAEVSRPRTNPAIMRALQTADVNAGIAESPEWREAMQGKSFVNYASAPLGAKKYEASSLSR